MDSLLKQYVAQLKPNEKIAMKIAETQLESSFELDKSIGFLTYLNKNNIKQSSTSSKINNHGM